MIYFGTGYFIYGLTPLEGGLDVMCMCLSMASQRRVFLVLPWAELEADDPEEITRAKRHPKRYRPLFTEFEAWADRHVPEWRSVPSAEIAVPAGTLAFWPPSP